MRRLARVCVVFAAAALLAATSGCTYLGNRGRDAAQMLDLGFTFTKTPQFGIYGNCPLVTPVGYSNIDGYYAGMGGGHLGVTKHKQKDTGLLLWGKEENSWTKEGKDGAEDATSHENAKAGVVGLAQGVAEGNTSYKPACIHYLHLGWIGVAANAQYYEMYDFMAGFVGFDPSRDDIRSAPSEPTVVVKVVPGIPPLGGPRTVRLRQP